MGGGAWVGGAGILTTYPYPYIYILVQLEIIIEHANLGLHRKLIFMLLLEAEGVAEGVGVEEEGGVVGVGGVETQRNNGMLLLLLFFQLAAAATRLKGQKQQQQQAQPQDVIETAACLAATPSLSLFLFLSVCLFLETTR